MVHLSLLTQAISVLSTLVAGTEPAQQHTEHYKYCVVGAGPAGVQLGHYLHNAQRDYILLERSCSAAAFFQKYPIHRVLNSINRRFTRSGNLEFNLRHDWNSLLDSHETVALFGNWSRDYWPRADTLVEYINAFAAPQVASNRLQFGNEVTKISTGSSAMSRYVLNVQRRSCESSTVEDNITAGSSVRSLECEVLVMANGMWQPRNVTELFDGGVDGLEGLVIQYDELDTVPLSSFENKSVVIFGGGNAAMETADAIRDFARDLRLVTRSANVMGDTHYVGHLRARRTTLFDAFQLKSYEGYQELKPHRAVFVPCGPDDVNVGFNGRPPVCGFQVVRRAGRSFVYLCPVIKPLRSLIEDAYRVFGDRVFEANASRAMQTHQDEAQAYGVSLIMRMPNHFLAMSVGDLKQTTTLEERVLLVRLLDTTLELTQIGTEFQKPFDIAISAIGWVYNQSIFDTALKTTRSPGKAGAGQYPELNSEFESVSHAHLFVAGSASHGRDRYRYRASGGFIHGFRFNVRTLWRILEDRYENDASGDTCSIGKFCTEQWTTQYPLKFEQKPNVPPRELFEYAVADTVYAPNGADPLWDKLLQRINTAAGPYEMVGGSLADAIVYNCADMVATYFEDLPEDLVHERYYTRPRLTWSYHYGCHSCDEPEEASFAGLRTVSAGVFSKFVHPVLQYFPPNIRPIIKDTPAERTGDDHPSSYFDKIDGVSRLHIKESYIFLDWNDVSVHHTLGFFMAHVESAVADFCSGAGNGTVRRGFDEIIDVSFRRDRPQKR